MQLPLQITFRNMNPSEAVETKIRERADKLDRFADHVMSCRVIVEAPHKHHHKGALYQVLIDITVPGKELVVSRAPHDNHAHEDVYVAVRDAFDAARRQLEDYTRVIRGKTKLHEPPPQGRIRNMMFDQNFGVIETIDGREVYFHRNSLLNGDFEKLDIGTQVRFSEELGEKGPQASSVHVVSK